MGIPAEKLIDLVEEHRILYEKPQGVYYRDTECRDKLWQEIAEQLGTQDVKAVKEKWRNLKDTYIRETKQARGRHGHGTRKKKKWKHFDRLSSFMGSAADRRSDGHIRRDDDEEKWRKVTAHRQRRENVAVEAETGGSSSSAASERGGGSSSSAASHSRDKWKAERGGGGGGGSNSDEWFEEYAMSVLNKQPDAEESFLLSLAPMLRALPPEKRSLAKIELLTVLHKLQFTPESTTTTTTTTT